MATIENRLDTHQPTEEELLLARARDAAKRKRPLWQDWKQDPELWGYFIESGEYEHHDGETVETVPTRLYRRLDGEYVRVFLWNSPQRLRELHDELDPQPGDFVYMHVHEKVPKRDKPGETWTPVDMEVTRAAEIDAPAGDEATETALVAERDERDAAVNDDGKRGVDDGDALPF